MLLPIRRIQSPVTGDPEVVETFTGEELFDGFTTVQDSIAVSAAVTGGKTPNSTGTGDLWYVQFRSSTSPAVATVTFDSPVKRVKLYLKHHEEQTGSNDEKIGGFKVNGSTQNPTIILDPGNSGFTDIAIDANGDILGGTAGPSDRATYYLEWSAASINSVEFVATGYNGGTSSLEFQIGEIELGI